MKHSILFLILSVFVLFSCGGGSKTSGDAAEGDTIDSSRLVNIKYSVEGMTCTGCEKTVSAALEEINGVKEVTSSFEGKYVMLTYDSVLVHQDQIAKAINGKGYTFVGIFQGE